MARFPWQKAETSDGKEEFTLPDELQKQIKDGADAAAQLPKITEMLAGLNSLVQEQVTSQKKRDDAGRQQQQQQQSSETSQELEERIEALMLEGKTKDAIALATRGQTLAIKAIHAEQVRKELFDSEPDKFQYYSGDIKREVDALIANQGVDFRTNALNIENCYHTVLGKHTKEIVEGKLKTRFASGSGGSGTSNGSAGSTGASDGKESRIAGIAANSEVIRAARQCGIPVAEYAKMLEEDGVAYV
jgi:hypothetical protein